MVEILFGPDGVGKSTLAKQFFVEQEAPLILHGTNIDSWFGPHADVLNDLGYTPDQVPSDDNFYEKIAFVNEASLAIAGLGQNVIIDGHVLHKTAINVAAGLVSLEDAPAGTKVKALVDGPLSRYFEQMHTPDVTHTHVLLPSEQWGMVGARELQRRLDARPDKPSWDAVTAQKSHAQLIASYRLAVLLLERGFTVEQATSLPPELLDL